MEHHMLENKESAGSNVKPEERETVFEKLPHAEAVVVLGEESKRDKNGKIVPTVTGKMRIIGALELWRRGLVDKIILSGGTVKESPWRLGKETRRDEGGRALRWSAEDIPTAEAMKSFLLKFGVPAEKIIVETASMNTAENLENVLDILEKEDIKSILLETSEFHLGRAKQLLKNVLEKHGLKLQVGTVSAEELLMERSPHYRELVSQYRLPDSLIKAPKEVFKKGLREFLRRILIYIDRDDKIAKFLVHKFR